MFQKVQEAYELLSDDAKRAKHDRKVLYAGQKKYAASSGKSTSGVTTTFRTARGGKLYEERSSVRTYDDSEEEPRVSSRKYETYDRKASSKDSDAKKKTKAAESKRAPSRSATDRFREAIRSSHSERAKTRDKERKREQSDKHSRTIYIATDEPEPDKAYERQNLPKSKAAYESVRTDNDKMDSSPQYIYAEEYIRRSKVSAPEYERRGSAPISSSHSIYYHTVEGDTARRSSARPVRASPGDSSRAPMGRREPVFDGYDLRTSRMAPSPASPAGIRLSAGARNAPPPRASTTYPVRPVKEVPPTLRRAETAPLASMASRRPEPISRPSRPRDRYDSGYSSPGTPEMYGTSPTKSSKFTIVEEDDEYAPSHRAAMGDQYSRHQSVSPSRHRVQPITVRATSRPPQSRPREPVMRTESARAIPTMRTSPPPLRRGSTRDALFAEVGPDLHRYPPEQVRYSPRIRHEDVNFQKVPYPPTTVLPRSYAY